MKYYTIFTLYQHYQVLYFFRFLREALNLSRSVLAFKYVVHELIPEKNQYNNLRAGDPDWNAWNPEHMAKGKGSNVQLCVNMCGI